MIGRSVGASVKSHIDVKAGRSQSLLVTLAIVGGVSLVCGAVIVAMQNLHGLWFLGFSAVPFGLAFRGWWKSQADTDFDNAKPTTVVLADGKSITTDGRTFINPVAVEGLTRVLEHFQRPVLVEASGIVDAQYQVIPGTEQAAAEATARIQAQADQYLEGVVEGLKAHHQGKMVSQPSLEGGAAPQAMPSQVGMNGSAAP